METKPSLFLEWSRDHHAKPSIRHKKAFGAMSGGYTAVVSEKSMFVGSYAWLSQEVDPLGGHASGECV